MPRVDTTVEARRVDVAQRYLRGEMQSQIAHAFGVSQQQISQDLKAIRSLWLASAIRDFDAAKAQELAKIDEVERAAWNGWARSQEDKEVTFSEVGVKGARSGSRSEGQAGAPAFLQVVLSCIERRCKILGLDAPQRFSIEWDTLDDDQLERLAKGEPPEKVLTA